MLAGLLVLPTVLGSNDDTTTTTSTTTTVPTTTTTTAPPTTIDAEALPLNYEGFRSQTTACGAEAPPPVTEMTFAAAEDQGIPADAKVTATITTSCGDIIVELDPSIAPETVNSFVFLAKAGYFDGTAFHRIAPGFVIQGGDQTAIGTGNPGYLVADEFPEAGFTYGRGVVAMANGGANSTGSQFFIVTADDAGLPNGIRSLVLQSTRMKSSIGSWRFRRSVGPAPPTASRACRSKRCTSRESPWRWDRNNQQPAASNQPRQLR